MADNDITAKLAKKKLKKVLKQRADREKLREELCSVSADFLAGNYVSGPIFRDLLKAYDHWDRIPPRTKGFIIHKLKWIKIDKDSSFLSISTGKCRHLGRLVRSLMKSLDPLGVKQAVSFE